jgi:hypothetical protein
MNTNGSNVESSGSMFFWARIWKNPQLSGLKLNIDMGPDPIEAKFLDPDPIEAKFLDPDPIEAKFLDPDPIEAKFLDPDPDPQLPTGDSSPTRPSIEHDRFRIFRILSG